MRYFWLGFGGALAFLVVNSYTGIVAPVNAGGLLGIGK